MSLTLYPDPLNPTNPYAHLRYRVVLRFMGGGTKALDLYASPFAAAAQGSVYTGADNISDWHIEEVTTDVNGIPIEGLSTDELLSNLVDKIRDTYVDSVFRTAVIDLIYTAKTLISFAVPHNQKKTP